MTETETRDRRGTVHERFLRGVTRWSFLAILAAIIAVSIASRFVLLPTSAYGNLSRGAAYLKKEDYEAAIEALTRSIELDPSQIEAYKLRGYARDQLGDTKGALGDFEKALTLSSSDADAWLGRARTRERMQDLPGALADYDRALTLDPKKVKAWLARAGARATTGEVDGALEDFTRSLQLDPKNGTAYVLRAGMHFDQHRWDEAVFGLTMGSPRCPPGAERDTAQLLLWAARSRRGDRSGATRALEEYARGRERDERSPWVERLTGFLSGARIEADLLRGAEDGPPKSRAARKCEALFYTGEKRLLEGDGAGALEHFRRAREAGERGSFTSARALAEVCWLVTGFRAKPSGARPPGEAASDAPAGLVVTARAEGGPAAQAGIEDGDVIADIAGRPATLETLSELAREGRAGTAVEVGLVRGGARRVVEMTLARSAAFSPTR